VQELFPSFTMLRYMNAAIPWPYPEDGAISFIRMVLPRMSAQEEYYWAIYRKGYEEGMIGTIGLTPGSDSDHRGFWLAEAFWGQGYMTEAVAAVNDFAFDRLGMPEMLLGNARDNVGSHRLKEKAGAEIIGFEESDYVSGRLPSVKWRLTAEAWRKHREAFLLRRGNHERR
jgi:RimJ/RimL family protein N-acetyltransferase